MSETARGTPYVIAAPSGAGKTSLVRALIDSLDAIVVSVSHTTRAPRPGEQDGVHYHFVDVARFRQMRAAGQFLEHAQVFSNYYGTSREWVEQRLRQGVDVILEIDWQGARQAREQLPGCIGIFILPPSRQILQERLRGRGQDDEAVIARRMAEAISEMSHYTEFDYLVVNDDFDRALAELQAIVRARRLTLPVQCAKLAGLLTDLLS